jgi:hypothetical protein
MALVSNAAADMEMIIQDVEQEVLKNSSEYQKY